MIFMTLFLTAGNVESFNKYVAENGEAGEQIELADNDILFAFLNKEYLNPQKSAVWPRDSWVDAVK